MALIMVIDGIGPKLLKDCAPAPYEQIFHLFSKCLSQCYIPQEWHIHKFTLFPDDTKCVTYYGFGRQSSFTARFTSLDILESPLEPSIQCNEVC